MSSRKKTMEQARAMDAKAATVKTIQGDDTMGHWARAPFVEDERDAGYKDGIYTASVTIDEVLQAVRVDTENADLDPVAATAAKLTIEAISRLWYERKGAL